MGVLLNHRNPMETAYRSSIKLPTFLKFKIIWNSFKMPFLYFAFTCKDKILSNNFIKILDDSITGAVNFLERKH